jgi:hypothetical protein
MSKQYIEQLKNEIRIRGGGVGRTKNIPYLEKYLRDLIFGDEPQKVQGSINKKVDKKVGKKKVLPIVPIPVRISSAFVLDIDEQTIDVPTFDVPTFDEQTIDVSTFDVPILVCS